MTEKCKKMFTFIKERKKTILIIFAIVSLLVSTTVFGYKYYSLTRNPDAGVDTEINTLLDEISELVLLPTDETPTIATVSDPVALKDQPFFVNAELGDKVLIYTNSRKAILYRPSIKKIIEIAPINLDANNANVEE